MVVLIQQHHVQYQICSKFQLQVQALQQGLTCHSEANDVEGALGKEFLTGKLTSYQAATLRPEVIKATDAVFSPVDGFPGSDIPRVC
ncbi:hypothetical protein E6O75_ATG02133 [Venturia nashicola]|uniref:Uncharacterized protein n=1 Tax=Venturia nashicola TaxID=86259 RepID=A0A4Z1P818_9PEZI|nr:hypothetical protein E6O75_ATG02133 [Venturia nashicola]